MYMHPNARPLLNPKSSLQPLVNEKARGRKRHNLDVPDRQPDPEPAEPPLAHDQPRRLPYPEPVAVAHRAADLHPAADDLERVARRLRHEARDAAGHELGPRDEGRGFPAGRVGGLREGGVPRYAGVAEEVAGRVVREEGHARVGEHAEEGRGEAAVEVDEAGARGDGGYSLREWGGGCGVGLRVGLFVVDLLADPDEAGAVVALRLEGEAHADHFQRVGEEDRGDARQRAAYEPPERGLVPVVGDHDGADLFVGEEFYAGVGEDSEEGCAVAPEEAEGSVLDVDVFYCLRRAERGAGVFSELGVIGLKEDLDAV